PRVRRSREALEGTCPGHRGHGDLHQGGRSGAEGRGGDDAAAAAAATAAAATNSSGCGGCTPRWGSSSRGSSARRCQGGCSSGGTCRKKEVTGVLAGTSGADWCLLVHDVGIDGR